MTAPGAEKNCDLCGGVRFELISRRDRKGGELLTGVCTVCGLVAHMQIPSDEQLDEFYAEHYRRKYHRETTPSARRVMRAWKNGQRIYSRLAPLIGHDDFVFEIGSGIGCTVKAFELCGHRVAGIEPNKGFCRLSVDQLRAPVA